MTANSSNSISEKASSNKVALITGGSARIGAVVARQLHAINYNIIVHYNHSEKAAKLLCEELESLRADSSCCFQADLLDLKAVEKFSTEALSRWGRVDLLINNASSFYPTPLQTISEENWTDLMGTNAKAPAFLAKAFAPSLKKNRGNIINLSDIAAKSGRADFSIYTMAKAALSILTKSLARELAPEVRVNSIAPGIILPPNFSSSAQEEKPKESDPLEETCLNYSGKPEDIANTVVFLCTGGTYITGQTINVDGGKNLKT